MKNSFPFHKDFILVVFGQIISLFGNAILRFALPLYLFNETGSAMLFGIISAIAIIPMILLTPIGGLIADRINKRNIMVVLDFSTSILTLLIMISLHRVSVVTLVLVAMILLYSIQSTYQPAVQASIPLLVDTSHVMQANAIINLVSSVATLVGPSVGGVLYSYLGLKPLLAISAGCFLFSAIMEIFIHIPFTKAERKGTIINTGISDLKEGIHYISKDEPCILKVSFVVGALNLFLSCVLIIGLPIIVNQYLQFDSTLAKQLYGYVEGSISAGCLLGGIMTGIIGNKVKVSNSPKVLLICTLLMIPIGLSLQFVISPMVTYIIVLVSCFLVMAVATLFSIQMMSYLQILTPQNLLGKVISCALCIGTCAQPIGLAFYGCFFEWLKAVPYIPFYFAIIVTCAISILTKPVFVHMEQVLKDHDIR